MFRNLVQFNVIKTGLIDGDQTYNEVNVERAALAIMKKHLHSDAARETILNGGSWHFGDRQEYLTIDNPEP